MDPFLIIAILTPIVTRIITLAEKKYGKGKGKTKKNWAVKEIGKAWNESVAAGLITGDLAKLPVSLILPIISMLIDSLIIVVNQSYSMTKNPKTAKKVKK